MNEFVNDFVSLKISKGVFYVIWFNYDYTPEIIDFGVKKRTELSSGKSYPMLSDFRQVKKFADKTCRDRLTEEDACKDISALAVVVKNKIQYLYVSIVTQINKSRIPIQIFTDYEKAHSWLQQFKNHSDETEQTKYGNTTANHKTD